MPKVVILGAGLTGLSAAYHLEKYNFFDYQIFEKDNSVGGLCRSITQDNFTFDYTGHLLHLNNNYFAKLIYNLLDKDKFNYINRKSFIYSHNIYTKYPYQVNLFGLPKDVIVDNIKDYINRPSINNPKNFYDWALTNFGSSITKNFFEPYQNKIFAYNIKKITASWTSRFVPKTSLTQMLSGAINNIDNNSQNIGYNSQFIYPKSGGIFSWVKALSEQIKSPINKNHKAINIDLKNKIIKFENSKEVKFKHLITTMPLDSLLNNITEPSNLNLKKVSSNLLCNSVINFNLGTNIKDLSNKHWIYFPEPKYKFYRIGFPHNFTKLSAPENCSSLYGEFAYLKNNKINTKAKLLKDLDISLKQTKELLNIKDHNILTQKIIPISHAYVIFDKWRENNLDKILDLLKNNNIHSCGRYGAWKYASMQEAILDGKDISEKIISAKLLQKQTNFSNRGSGVHRVPPSRKINQLQS